MKCLIIVRHRSNDCEVFFMTKYSNEFKIKIVSEYFTHQNSMAGLSKEYNVSFHMIQTWIHQAEKMGLILLRLNIQK